MTLNYPRLGVSAAIYSDGKLLLIKRGKEPFKGYWSLPGGSVEYGETLEDAIIREIREETSLTVSNPEFADFHEPIGRDAEGRITHHFLLARFICPKFSGKAQAGDDAEVFVWATLANIEQLQVTDGTKEFIRSHLMPLLT